MSRTFATAAICLFLSSAACSPAWGLGYAQDEDSTSTQADSLTIGRSGNLRSGPATSYEVIGSVSTGMEVTKLEQKDSWFRVELPDGTEGWVHQILVEGVVAPTANVFVGELERFQQSYTPTMQGLEAEEEIELFLVEHPDKGFTIKKARAIKAGLFTEESPGLYRFAGKGWEVRFTTEGEPVEVAYNSTTRGRGKYDSYSVKELRIVSRASE